MQDNINRMRMDDLMIRVKLLSQAMASAYAQRDWQAFAELSAEYESKTLEARTLFLELGAELPPMRNKGVILDY